MVLPLNIKSFIGENRGQNPSFWLDLGLLQDPGLPAIGLQRIDKRFYPCYHIDIFGTAVHFYVTFILIFNSLIGT